MTGIALSPLNADRGAARTPRAVTESVQGASTARRPTCLGAQEGTPAQRWDCRMWGQGSEGRRGFPCREKRGHVRTARHAPRVGEEAPALTRLRPQSRSAGAQLTRGELRGPGGASEQALRRWARPPSLPHGSLGSSVEGRSQRKVALPGQTLGAAPRPVRQPCPGPEPSAVTVHPAHARPHGVSVAPAPLHTEATARTATAAPVLSPRTPRQCPAILTTGARGRGPLASPRPRSTHQSPPPASPSAAPSPLVCRDPESCAETRRPVPQLPRPTRSRPGEISHALRSTRVPRASRPQLVPRAGEHGACACPLPVW